MHGGEIVVVFIFTLGFLYASYLGIRWGLEILDRREFERKYQARYKQMIEDFFDEKAEE